MRLSLTEGLGNEGARRLLSAFGLPAQVFAQSQSALQSVVGARKAQALCCEPAELAELVARTWDWLQADPLHRRVLALGDAAYPTSLLHLEDPPLILYAVGTAMAWQERGLSTLGAQAVAVVGSRNPTPQGLGHARQFARALAQADRVVVSGMALGVDGAAHEGALEGARENAIATVAVVGTGLDRVYPRQHRDLAHRIAQRGLLLSEYHLGTPPLAANFPRRNRLIAGLSAGTLVVEAAMQSGSLITARLAAEQGKEVFAIPGSIHATQARGCHALIKQGAKLVESAQDILDELGGGSPAAEMHSPDATAADADPAHAGLLAALGFEPCGLDALQARTGLPTATLLAQLLTLELGQQVARLPGGLFQRVVAV